jgi:hypothetical protein
MIPSKNSQKLLKPHHKTLKNRKNPRFIPYNALKKLSKTLKNPSKTHQKTFKKPLKTAKIPD